MDFYGDYYQYPKINKRQFKMQTYKDGMKFDDSDIKKSDSCYQYKKNITSPTEKSFKTLEESPINETKLCNAARKNFKKETITDNNFTQGNFQTIGNCRKCSTWTFSKP